MKYGYIGLGNLGGHLAMSLIRNGFEVVVHDIDKSLGERHIAAGGLGRNTAGARGAGRSRLHLPPVSVVSEKVLKQILETLKPGCTWLENSTNGRDEMIRLSKLAEAKGVKTSNVGAGRRPSCGARRGSLCWWGGESELFEFHRKALQSIGKKIFHMGPVGSPRSSIKVITNMLAFIHLVADAEALMLAKRGGLDLAQAWHAITASSGTSFVHETEGQLILNGSYDIAFTMDLALKDLGFAMAFGKEFGVPLDLASMTNQTFMKGKAVYGGAAQSTQIAKLLEDALGTDLRASGVSSRLE